MEQFVFGDHQLAVTVTREEHGCWVELTDLVHEHQWPRTPLLALEIYAKAEFRTETLREYRIDRIEAVADGVHIILGDDFRQVRIGLWLCVQHGELVATMPMAEWYEDKQATFRLFTVLLLPELMQVDAGGVMLLPLNTGMLCYPAGKPARADRFMIYGEQSRWELVPMLPVCAVHTARGGLLALATRGAAETCCLVSTDGAGNGGVGFAMSLRQLWPDKVEFETREIRFCPLSPAANLVQTVAKRLRRHVMDDLGKPTLRERAAASPEVASLLGSYTMKLFFGVENNGIMMHGQAKGDPVTFRRVMTFDEASALLQQVYDAGITQVHTQSVGWNPSAHDGLWPTRFPIEDRLGGEARFRALIEAGKALGFTMNVHDNQLSVYRRSPDYNERRVVHDMWGQPMGLGEWGGGITYIMNTLTVSDEELEREMRRLKALGLTGAGYLDGMGNPLYRDYHPEHPMTRTDYARATVRLIEIAKRVYGSAGTECGFLYCVIPADSMVTPERNGTCRRAGRNGRSPTCRINASRSGN